MASTVAARRLAESYRQAQAQLGAGTVARLDRVWSLLDPASLDATSGRWLQATRPIVQVQYQQSAALAGEFLTTFRAMETGSAAGFAATAATLNLEALTVSLLVTGPVHLKQQMSKQTLERAATNARAASAAAGMRHALAGGRDSILASVRDDDLALGWARWTSGSPCAFCALMASRGPVYESREAAAFEPHDKCFCTPVPVYDRDAPWPPGAREFQQIYDQAAKGESDPLNAFRRAYERP